MTLLMPKMEPKSPTTMGLLWSGRMKVTMMIEPEKIPADPTPAIALPTMNAFELGAAPQMMDPSSKKTMAER